MEKETRLCKDCVNFIVDDENRKASCDFMFFNNDDIFKAIIYVPDLFDCDRWEVIEDGELVWG